MFRTEPLGSPGVYMRHPTSGVAYSSERMDVCAFVGIAPRGPSREPLLPDWWRPEEGSFMPQWQSGSFETQRSSAVAVESFDEYRRLYGGFEGPGKLPYAVSTFFQQGGKRAYIIRVVHKCNDQLENAKYVATGTVADVALSNGESLKFLARSEGQWGNKLRVGLGFSTTASVFESSDINGLTLRRTQAMPVGTLLRCYLPNARPQLSFISDSRVAINGGERKRRITLASPLLEPPTKIEIVEAEIRIDDGAGITEVFTGLGLSSAHPRWLANELCYQSQIIYPNANWNDVQILPVNHDRLPVTATLPNIETAQFTGGEDRYTDLSHEDFFDGSWSPTNEYAGSGVHALANNPEVACVTIPDLYCPEPMPDITVERLVVSLAGDEFEECVEIETDGDDPLLLPDINQLCLNPSSALDLEKIIELQRRFVDFSDQQRCWLALLDVPPGLRSQQIAAWRINFDSSYAAAYFPWLNVVRGDDQRNEPIQVNPSAAAAGIIANKELTKGLHHGPANELVPNAVSLDDSFSPRDLDLLHPLGLNAYVMDVDGIRLCAARTLSNNPHFRQINIRRLMILLKRTLLRQSQWVVFEPNNRALWRKLSHALESYLLELYRAGAFRGATANEAFFVHCNEQTNTRQTIDAGQLIVEVGVAPAEPMEFIVLRITHDADSTSVLEV